MKQLVDLFGDFRNGMNEATCHEADSDKHSCDDAHQRAQKDENVFPTLGLMHSERDKVIPHDQT